MKVLPVRHGRMVSRRTCLLGVLMLSGILSGCVTSDESLSGQSIYYVKDYMTESQFRDYKAFAIHKGLDSGGRAWGARTPDRAIARAMKVCQEHTAGVPCELYAIGNTVVHRMMEEQIEAVKRRYVRTVSSAPLSPDALRDFNRYRSPTKPGFKAFAYSPIGAYRGWSYAFWDSKSAINRALRECKLKAGRDCQLYALGTEIVYGKTAEELEAAILEADKESRVDPRK